MNGAAFHVPRTLAAVADAEGHKDWLDGLRAWNGMGAVRLYAAAEYPQTNVLLLERCLPARSVA